MILLSAGRSEPKKELFRIHPLTVFLLLLAGFALVLVPVLAEENTHRSHALPQIYISIDPDELWNDDYGLMAEGPLSGTTDPETGEILLPNYMMTGEDWVRPATVSIINSEGYAVIQQEVGLALSGGTSRGYDTPSLKLVADAWDEDAKLYWDDLEKDAILPLSHVRAYNDLKLRTGSQDAAETNIRSAVMSTLCRESGFPGYLPEERAMIWLNGEIYAICSIQPRYIPSFLARRFNLPEADGIEIIGSSELNCLSEAGLLELAEADMNIPENREKLEAAIDTEDLLFYAALQVLSNNVDWPGNNFKMWRWTGDPVPENPRSDGRYRCLLYDSDLIWLPEGFLTGIFGTDTFRAIMESRVLMNGTENNPSLIGHMLNAKPYRDRFLNLVTELLDSTFSPEHLIQAADAQLEAIREVTIQVNGEDAWAIRRVATEMMKSQMLRTPERMAQDLAEYLGAEGQYTLHIRSEEGACVSLSALHLASGTEGTFHYYQDAELTLHADAIPGYDFSGWIVNGKLYHSPDLLITPEMIAQQPLEAEALAISAAESMTIAEIRAKGKGDWIRLENTGAAAVDLGHYAISDSSRFRSADPLPSARLESGESIVIDCENNQSADSLVTCSFNLSQGETICLWDLRDYSIVDRLTVPRMSENETFGREPGTRRNVFFPAN